MVGVGWPGKAWIGQQGTVQSAGWLVPAVPF